MRYSVNVTISFIKRLTKWKRIYQIPKKMCQLNWLLLKGKNRVKRQKNRSASFTVENLPAKCCETVVLQRKSKEYISCSVENFDSGNIEIFHKNYDS